MAKKEKVKQKIITRASEIFSKYGYRKTTMDDIAEKSDMGKSSIYYYFQSKEQIFQAVVLQEAIIFRQEIMTAIDKQENPFEKLKAYVLTRTQIVHRLVNFDNALQNKKLMVLDFVGRLNNLYNTEEVRLFQKILQEGKDIGIFKEYDSELAAKAIVMAMKGMERNFMLHHDDPNLNRKIDQIIDIILYGIAKK